jgi:hypothetical protein
MGRPAAEAASGERGRLARGSLLPEHTEAGGSFRPGVRIPAERRSPPTCTHKREQYTQNGARSTFVSFDRLAKRFAAI